MDRIIQEIVNTDKALRLDVEKAKERRENLTAELAQKKIIIDNEHKHNAEETIGEARQNAEEEIAQTSLEIQKKIDEKKQQLNAIYEENHTKWETEIYNAIINE